MGKNPCVLVWLSAGTVHSRGLGSSGTLGGNSEATEASAACGQRLWQGKSQAVHKSKCQLAQVSDGTAREWYGKNSFKNEPAASHLWWFFNIFYVAWRRRDLCGGCLMTYFWFLSVLQSQFSLEIMAQVTMSCCLGEKIRTPEVLFLQNTPLHWSDFPLIISFVYHFLGTGRSSRIREQKLFCLEKSPQVVKIWDFFFSPTTSRGVENVCGNLSGYFWVTPLLFYTTNEEKLWVCILDYPLLLQLHFLNAIVGLFYLSLCGICPEEEQSDIPSHCDLLCVF